MSEMRVLQSVHLPFSSLSNKKREHFDASETTVRRAFRGYLHSNENTFGKS